MFQCHTFQQTESYADWPIQYESEQSQKQCNCVYEYKMAENALSICCLNLLITECNGDLGRFTLQYEQDYVISGLRQSSIMFSFIGF